MQVFYVNIGGGEPTVRPDFWELVDYATAHHVGVKFSTNGVTITPEWPRRLAASDYVDVQISLDGATAEINDAVRGAGLVRHGDPGHGEPGRRPGMRGFKISVVVHPAQHRPARRVQGARRPLRRPAAADPAAPVRPRRRRLGRAAPDRRAAARALRLAAGPRRGVLTGDSFFHLAAYGEALPGLNLCGAGRVVCLIDPVGRRLRLPVRDPREFLAGNVRAPGGFNGGLAGLGAVHRAAPAADRRGLRVLPALDSCRGGCMAAKFFTGLPLDGPDPECVHGYGEQALAERAGPSRPGRGRPDPAPPAGR